LAFYGEKMKKIPKELEYLLADETKAFAFLATSMPDGSPQVTPVWFNTEGEFILLNTAKGRIKYRNMQTNPQVALAIPDPQNSYRYIQIRGRVLEMLTEGGMEHIQKLAVIYTGKPWSYPDDQGRVICKIIPESIDAHP
jgi:PPOX class probable F420-dependent enzyme